MSMYAEVYIPEVLEGKARLRINLLAPSCPEEEDDEEEDEVEVEGWLSSSTVISWDSEAVETFVS